MLQDSTNSWKSFSASCWSGHGSIFPARCSQDAWSSGWLARGQVNMVDEAKLHSPVCSTFEALAMQCALRHCGELGPFCWPVLALGIAVLGASFNLLSILLRCNGFTRIQKAVMDQTSSRPADKWLWPYFGASLALGSTLELFLDPAT